MLLRIYLWPDILVCKYFCPGEGELCFHDSTIPNRFCSCWSLRDFHAVQPEMLFLSQDPSPLLALSSCPRSLGLHISSSAGRPQQGREKWDLWCEVARAPACSRGFILSLMWCAGLPSGWGLKPACLGLVVPCSRIPFCCWVRKSYGESSPCLASLVARLAFIPQSEGCVQVTVTQSCTSELAPVSVMLRQLSWGTLYFFFFLFNSAFWICIK